MHPASPARDDPDAPVPQTNRPGTRPAAQRILVVEDDPRILEELIVLLREAEYAVLPAATLNIARRILDEKTDLILLDLGLPDGNGLNFCRELRSLGHDIPVIILTARDAPEDIVRGLDAGADDYIVKPFKRPELLARMRTNLRRVRRTATGQRLSCGPIWAEPKTRTCGHGDRLCQLKPREFELLVFLLQNPGRPWTRDQILRRVWGNDYDGHSRTVDVHVRRLRERLEEDAGAPRYILTEFGVGYRLEGDPQ